MNEKDIIDALLRPQAPPGQGADAAMAGVGLAESMAPNIVSLLKGEPARPVPEIQGVAPGKVQSAEDPRLAGVGQDIVENFLGPPGAKAVGVGVGKFLPSIFVGPGALGLDRGLFKKAKEMAAQNKHPRDIWAETMWRQEPSLTPGQEKWQTEISDQKHWTKPHFSWGHDLPSMKVETPPGMSLDVAFNQHRAKVLKQMEDHLATDPYKMKDYLNHPELYGKVPEAANIRIRPETEEGYLGSWEGPNTINLRLPPPSGRGYYDKTAIHELQHAMDTWGKFQSGTSSTAMEPISEKLLMILDALPALKKWGNESKALDLLRASEGSGMLTVPVDQLLQLPEDAVQKVIKKNLPSGLYARKRGEAVARNSESRIPLSIEQRHANFPEEDVPINEQLFQTDRRVGVLPENYWLLKALMEGK